MFIDHVRYYVFSSTILIVSMYYHTWLCIPFGYFEYPKSDRIFSIKIKHDETFYHVVSDTKTIQNRGQTKLFLQNNDLY